MSKKPLHTDLLLIRHGQTDWNAAKKIQGHSDIPLNQTGIEQAQKAATFLSDFPIKAKHIYASDLQRAQTTANIIAQHHSLPVITTPVLREAHHGEAEGMTLEEREIRYANEMTLWKATPLRERLLYSPIPGAEPRQAIVNRVTEHIHTSLATHPYEASIMVTHAGVINSLIVDITEQENVPLPNCCIAHFGYDHETNTLFFYEVHTPIENYEWITLNH